jgi:type 1 glutamine amidotransferase
MKIRKLLFTLLIYSLCLQAVKAEYSLRILNFQADNGFQHDSKKAALDMIELLGVENNWEVVTSSDTADISPQRLHSFDVIIFNNNCGNDGRIFSTAQQLALQNYIKAGGGFVGIHCAGAIWHEGGAFQNWYEKLVGTRMVAHPKVQSARLIVEDNTHICTCHLPNEWVLTDEWHTFSYNPRSQVNVLLSLDESSYEGTPKMGGDHPFTWYQYYDGGRSFFTSLGHTIDIYADENYKKFVQGGIVWASGLSDKTNKLSVSDGLIVDLDADYGIVIENRNKISSWKNKAENNIIKSFDKQDEGREKLGSGMPRLVLGVPQLNGHNSVVFHRQELMNDNEDAFDHLSTGSGYTWFSIMSAYEQVGIVPDVNSFFGNLRNTNIDNKGKYEGIWGGLSDENLPWLGTRNAISFGRWDVNNPYVGAPKPLEVEKYYLVAGRMGAGTDTVHLELFVNNINSVAQGRFPVNPHANPSKMVIGQERDAINHPGAESFDGEIARFLIYERPLYDKEFKAVMKYLTEYYNIKE